MSAPTSNETPPVFISFSALINQTTTEALLTVLANEISQGASCICVALSTPGGAVSYGITAYNLLRAMPIKLITHNVGSVNSIGNVLFLAGAERYASPVSSFMFHGVGFDLNQSIHLEEKDIREKLDALNNDQKLITDIISCRTNIKAEECSGLFLRAAFMRSEEALERGMIHAIRDLVVPKGAKFLQLNLGR